VLFSIAPPGNWDAGEIVVESLSGNDRKSLIAGGTSARFLPSGHLIYALEDQLFAKAFDPNSLTASGQAVPVVAGVIRGKEAWETGVAQYDISDDGTLVYVTGDEISLSTVVWVDRRGEETPIPIKPGVYRSLRLSPDGNRFVVNDASEANDLLIWDFARQTTSRLELGGTGGDFAVWAPDGEPIFYHPSVGAVIDWRTSNNTGSPERLVISGDAGLGALHPTVFSAAGDKLIFQGRATPASGIDIGMGRNEIYVRPFPNIDDGLWQVSNRGGVDARWSRSGHEIFYLQPGSPTKLIAVAVQSNGNELTLGEGNPIIDWIYSRAAIGRRYDVSQDDRQFLAIKPSDSRVRPRIIIVQNWFEELKQLVPAE